MDQAETFEWLRQRSVRLEYAEAELETAERKLEESRRDLESVSEQRNTAVDKKRAGERKLAELEKAADAVIERFKIVTSWPDEHFSKELPIELGSEVAALASLRAESKEPVD